MERLNLTGGARIIAPPLRLTVRRGIERRLGRWGDAVATTLSGAGALQTISSEAIVLSPYYDSGRVLTLWIGHTKAAGAPDPVAWWGRTGTITQAVAQFLLDARHYADGVRRAFTRPLSQAQFDAAFDFNYNSGAIEVANWVKLFNAGRDAEAEASFLGNWHAPADRRAAEHQLFFKGTYKPLGTAPLFPADHAGAIGWSQGKTVDLSTYISRTARGLA